MVKNALSDLHKEDEVYRRARRIKVLINDSKYTAKRIISKNEIEFRNLVDHLECVRESLNNKPV